MTLQKTQNSFLNEPTHIKDVQEKTRQLKMEIKGITSYVRRLVNKEVLVNPQRGLYYVADTLLRLYIHKSHNQFT